MATFSSELAESLTQDEIPIKLRCASCNKLVVNAFRLPCCDQNVCENCQISLPDTCPVCMHSPLSADDCKPNKSLRLTVKAFLKNEEKKRDKQEIAVPTSTSAAPQTDPLPSIEPVVASIGSAGAQTTGNPDLDANFPETTAGEEEVTTFQESHDSTLTESATEQITEASVNPSQVENAQELSDSTNIADSLVDQSVAQTKEQGIDGAWNAPTNQNQQQTFNMGANINGTNNSFGQQSWNGAYNPMMNMPNAMAAGAWSNFPNMMGMSGMAMDPMMMSQGMFGGFNGQGIGMNGMNMGMGYDGGFGGWGGQSAMGMGGMNGGFGANAGYYPTGGYNQPSHQGHFNQMQQPQYPMNNSNQNRFRGHGHSHRGYDRGMGRHAGSGLAYAGSSARTGEENYSQQEQTGQYSRPFPKEAERPVEAKEQLQQGSDGDEVSKSLDVDIHGDVNPGDKHEDVVDNVAESIEFDTKTDGLGNTVTSNPVDSVGDREESTTNAGNGDRNTLEFVKQEEEVLQPIATVDTSDPPPFSYEEMEPMHILSPLGPNVPLGPAAQFATPAIPEYPGRGRGGVRPYGRGAMMRGVLRGRGGVARIPSFDHAGLLEVQASPPPPIGQGVVGAPTGPKAMREGHPNIGPRGRGGFGIAGRGVKPVTPVLETRPLLEQKSPSMEPRKANSRSPSRSRSTSRHRHRRHRSASVSDPEAVDSHDQRRSKKQRRSHRYEDDGNIAEDDQQSRYKHSRDTSTESRHRSHRDKGKSRSSRHDRSRSHERRKYRHRSRDREPELPLDRVAAEEVNGKESRSASGSRARHRSRRDNATKDDRDRDRERKGEKEHDRDRDRDTRDRDRDRKRSRRDNRSASPDQRSSHRRDSVRSKPAVITPTEPPSRPHHQLSDHPPPTGPREFKIKDRSKRAVLSDLEAPRKTMVAEVEVDPHTLEREARNRERMMREMQRRESLHSHGNGNGNGQANGNGTAGRKRSADEGVAVEKGYQRGIGGGVRKKSRHGGERDDRKGRRGGWQYEDEENGEQRAARVEEEREAARWG